MAKYSHYTQSIRELDATVNAVGVEAFTRLQYGTLDHLSREDFISEIRLAKQAEIASPGELRTCADSYNMLADFLAFEKEYLSCDTPADAPSLMPAERFRAVIETRKAGSLCETKACGNEGAGWVVIAGKMPDPTGFVCTEHGEKEQQFLNKRGIKARFATGMVVDYEHGLVIDWEFAQSTGTS